MLSWTPSLICSVHEREPAMVLRLRPACEACMHEGDGVQHWVEPLRAPWGTWKDDEGLRLHHP